jgi:hypothetical protein
MRCSTRSVGVPSAWLIQGIKAFAACRSPAPADRQSSLTALSTLAASATKASATTARVPCFWSAEALLLARSRHHGAAAPADALPAVGHTEHDSLTEEEISRWEARAFKNMTDVGRTVAITLATHAHMDPIRRPRE